jgi:hypothetical protein
VAEFFFQLELPEITDSIVATIPSHRERISTLLTDGAILSYSVSVSRNMVWCVISATDEQEAMELVISMPLYPYFTDVTCHPLLFHNTQPTAMPGISLN